MASNEGIGASGAARQIRLPSPTVEQGRRDELAALAEASGAKNFTAWIAAAVDAYAAGGGDGNGTLLPADPGFRERLATVLQGYGLSEGDEVQGVKIAVDVVARLLDGGMNPHSDLDKQSKG